MLGMHAVDRIEKLKRCPILKETVPASRYQPGDISPTDIDTAADVLQKRKENVVSAKAGLESERAEIDKAVSKKEELLKAGKCPTCGQTITADAAHPEHGTAEEKKRSAEIQVLLEDIKKEVLENDSQAAVLKEIQEIDEKAEKIRSEINTRKAEEKGKAELIEKYRKDLTENNRQKAEWNARKVETDVFCAARQKDLENIEKRLAELKAENAGKHEKIKLLSEKKKEFSNAVNDILLEYKTLESERKLAKESQKRMEEMEKSGEEIAEALRDLRIGAEKLAAEEEKIKAAEKEAAANRAAKKEIFTKAGMMADLEIEKEKLRTRLDGSKTAVSLLEKTIDQLKSQIAEKEMKIKEIAEKITAAGGAGNASFEETKKRLQESMTAVSGEIAKREEQRSAADREIGTFENEIRQLSRYEKEAEELRNKMQFLSFVAEDVSVLEEMYRRIRSEMRSKNIEALDRLLNEMFKFIYSNNAYSHLELDTDYNLKVHEKDGAILEPKQLSGGERAIFNLALRCAIYRLLSLGFGENNSGKTSLPPLIFDEPTVFLDSGHVRQLIKLIEHMGEDGVGQIIVVSHDESLIDSADRNFKIEKDPLTNASDVVN